MDDKTTQAFKYMHKQITELAQKVEDHSMSLHKHIERNALQAEEWALQSPEIDEISNALAKFRSNIPSISKNGLNTYTKVKYAKLEDILQSINPVLSANDINISQVTDTYYNELYLVTQVSHKSGQWIRGRFPFDIIPRSEYKQGQHGKMEYNQELGSIMTYLKKYSLQSILGIAPDDNDIDGSSKDK